MASDLRTEMPHGPQRSTHSTDGDAGPLTPILSTETSSTAKSRWQTRWGMHAYARRTLGMFLLFVTVCLWTLSNFLASVSTSNPPHDGNRETHADSVPQSIFADGSYNKPFFLTYANSSIYAFALIPMTVRYATKNGFVGLKRDAARLMREHKEARRLDTGHIEASHRGADRERLLGDAQVTGVVDSSDEPLSFRETMVLSMNFAIPWIAANYFAAACFEYTSVASGTIFLSTSSMWTLILGALSQIERLSVGKVAGVLASLVGVGLVASVDLSGESDENRGSFPHKSPGQIILGNAMAAFSAVIYGYYVTTLKKRVGNEDRVNMQLFFGLIGVWTLVFMWPVFVVLHFTKIETVSRPSLLLRWS